MKKIFLFLLITFCLLFAACDSSGGDKLPPISEAPYAQRLTCAVAIQAISDILYEYYSSGTLPANVSESENALVFDNAEIDDVVLEYTHYKANLTGTLTGGDSYIFDFSIIRRESAEGSAYCSLYAIVKDNKTKKIIINGTEYAPDK